MRIVAALGRVLANWYVAGPGLAIAGLVIGYGIFFYAIPGYPALFQSVPGNPKIGVIDIPFSGINENSAYVITAYLNYARLNPEIKGVLIKLASPGGGASASEQLYHETAKLREEKPVVMVMNGMVASGGYMMAMGVNHSYAKTSSLVGNVGVVAGTGPIFPPQIPEQIAFTGPYKLTGASRRDWISDLDLLKEAFVLMVVQERGDKLKITPEQVGEGKLYTGVEAVSLGLVDEIGSDTEAMAKVAELAGISNYGLVNVNVEVNRLFVQDLRRIYSSSGDIDQPLTESDVNLLQIMAGRQAVPSQGDTGQDGNASEFPEIGDLNTGPTLPNDFSALNRPMEFGALGQPLGSKFPDLPVEINQPQFYYLYVGADH